MPVSLKRGSLLVLALAILFWWGFMFAKHDPLLGPIVPFGDDPYDAVGSFGIVAGVLLAVISLVRAFRPYCQRAPTAAQEIFLVRSQASIAIAVLVTLVADAVALARHPAMWMHAGARTRLLALITGLAIVAGGALIRFRSTREGRQEPGAWRRAALVLAATIMLLAVYPERWINGFTTHMITVIIGDVILFANIRFFVQALVPFRATEASQGPPGRAVRYGWSIVLGIGVLFGVFAFLGEMSEGTGAPPLGRALLVASVFLGLATAGMLVAYAFLGKPLGLNARSQN